MYRCIYGGVSTSSKGTCRFWSTVAPEASLERARRPRGEPTIHGYPRVGTYPRSGPLITTSATLFHTLSNLSHLPLPVKVPYMYPRVWRKAYVTALLIVDLYAVHGFRMLGDSGSPGLCWVTDSVPPHFKPFPSVLPSHKRGYPWRVCSRKVSGFLPLRYTILIVLQYLCELIHTLCISMCKWMCR
jgi:hypothetical protein